MLSRPPHIAAANIVAEPPRYRWDEWNVTATYRPADPEVMARMARLTHRANVAATTAMAEWAIWRFERYSSWTVPYQMLEAAWASGVHTAYTRYFEFDDNEWRGVVRGPMRVALGIAGDLIWGLKTATRGENAAWMSNLAQHLLLDPEPFRHWLAVCLERLEEHYPESAANEDAVFEDEFDVGPWVPRELFDLSRPFDVASTRLHIKRFVSTLDYRQNPFLNAPDDMLDFDDYHSVPYSISESDS